MGVVGQCVDHGDRSRLRDRFDAVLSERAHHDSGDITRQHRCGVLDALAAAELRSVGVDDDRVTAQLGDAGLERQAGARRRLLEDHRDGPRAGQWSRREPVLLQPIRLVEDELLLAGAEVVVDQEVADPRHWPGHVPGPPVTSATRASSSATPNGLANTEFSPSTSCRPGTASIFPVTTTTGTSASEGSPRSSSSTLMPPRSGIIRSSRMRAGRWLLALTRPARPSDATATS